MKKLIGRLALALSLATGLGAAHAGPTVIDFDAGLDTSYAPFADVGLLNHGAELQQSGFFVITQSTKADAEPTDLVGALIDGTEVADTCFTVVCPANNSTRFLAMVDDGLPWMGRLDGDVFQIGGSQGSHAGNSSIFT